MSDLQELIAKLEGAETGDEDLDSAVGCYFSAPGGPYNKKPAFLLNPRPVTRSIDHAVQLIERALPGWSWSIDSDGFFIARVAPPEVALNGPGIFDRVGKSPALALCLALLRALQSKDPTP